MSKKGGGYRARLRGEADASFAELLREHQAEAERQSAPKPQRHVEPVRGLNHAELPTVRKGDRRGGRRR